jgi:hypothetical protein
MAPKIYPGMPKRFCSAKCKTAAHRRRKELMKSNEFYTPSHIIEIARACMGGIDLDPASCAIANDTVKASRFYDTRQNGLKRPWFGRTVTVTDSIKASAAHAALVQTPRRIIRHKPDAWRKTPNLRALVASFTDVVLLRKTDAFFLRR